MDSSGFSLVAEGCIAPLGGFLEVLPLAFQIGEADDVVRVVSFRTWCLPFREHEHIGLSHAYISYTSS
jgi:hypothetical protein